MSLNIREKIKFHFCVYECVLSIDKGSGVRNMINFGIVIKCMNRKLQIKAKCNRIRSKVLKIPDQKKVSVCWVVIITLFSELSINISTNSYTFGFELKILLLIVEPKTLMNFVGTVAHLIKQNT